ncbi:acyl-CoA/acyl-ACP dehydrogenase [Parahaliea sp. F7430]|uniref:Acyl-CoA/acyl-ACP dehydrogenase n=1 Tax=Sediminihaliea albiluteola TaxID=2758564 RepID=A0A7W2YKH1_9GAMM|nr:acyl-CoA dehydrogenase family protein [Sediminihaliea albiluteola]MBA6414170.1 acyl-CoA/acyl-ACP dehydrogenase [Sediminihaliea albiluteola]
MSVIANTKLSFDEDQAMIMEVAREFCRNKSTMQAVRGLLDSASGFDSNAWRELADLGWLGIALPEQLGGSGLGVAHTVAIVEAMGRSMLSGPFVTSTLAAQLVLRAGSSAVGDRLLRDVIAGVPATVAQLESADWGSDSCACLIDDNGQLQGSKRFVADAEVAGWLVLVSRYRGAPALALIQAEQLPPAAIKTHTLVDETKRAATIDFSGLQLAPEAIISTEGLSAALRDYALLGALLSAAEATGSAAACLDSTVEYLKTRKQFGKLIGSYQALKHPCVDILNAIDASRSFLYHAATLLGDEPLSRDAEIACRMAKAQASETLLYASDRAVQFHGAMGFTYDCDAQLYIRRAQWSQQQFGDAAHHRKRLAALLLDE